MHRSSPPPSWRLGTLLLLVAAFLIVFQDVSLFTNPRLRAEEGTFFFRRAFIGAPVFDTHWIEVGYLDLLPVLGALGAANLVPLEWAPLFAGVVALLAQLLPAGLVVFSRSPVFGTPARRLLGVLAVCLLMPFDGIWLSTLASKFYLATVPVLLLLDALARDRSSGSSVVLMVLMALSPLASSNACFLTPLVIWLAWRPGGPHLRALALAFLVGVLLQGVLILGAPERGELQLSVVDRAGHLDPSAWGVSVVTDGLMPLFLGKQLTFQATRGLAAAAGEAGVSFGLLKGAALALVAGLFLIVGGRGPLAILVAGWALVTGGSLALALGPLEGPLGNGFPARYFIAPSLLLCWLLIGRLSVSGPVRESPRSVVAAILLAGILAGGAYQWFSVEVESPDRPSWPDEIARWRADPEHLVLIPPPPTAIALRGPSELPAEAKPVPLGDGPVGLQLSAGRPRLGGVLRVRVQGLVPGAEGTLHIQPGRPALPREIAGAPGPTILPRPLDSETRLGFRADASGCWTLELPLARSLSYAGLGFTLQAFSAGPDAAVSNGLFLRLGR